METWKRELRSRWEALLNRIDSASRRVGRDPKEVLLVAVSKTQPIRKILALYEFGQRHFGENRIPEVLEKKSGTPQDIVWHMIGHLQSNKAKNVLSLSWVDSLDSVSTIRELQKELQKAGTDLNVLIEVNTSNESTKQGISSWDEMELLARALGAASRLHPQGLMTMAPLTQDEAILRRSFRDLKDWRERVAVRFPGNWNELSMGMSNDFEIAIEEGSTMVRVGTALFGDSE